MAIDEDPFPLVASVNTVSFDLRALIESKKARKLSPRKVWVPKYCLVRVDFTKNFNLRLQNTLNMLKTTRVYFGVLQLSPP